MSESDTTITFEVSVPAINTVVIEIPPGDSIDDARWWAIFLCWYHRCRVQFYFNGSDYSVEFKELKDALESLSKDVVKEM